MPMLKRVCNPNEDLRIDGQLLVFDGDVPIHKVAGVVARAYQAGLEAQGIGAKVYVGRTADAPGHRSFAVYVEGVHFNGSFEAAPLLQVFSGERDSQIFTVGNPIDADNLAPDKRAFVQVDRGSMFDSYVGKGIPEILGQ